MHFEAFNRQVNASNMIYAYSFSSHAVCSQFKPSDQLKVEPCDRSSFSFNLNALATKTGRFTELGVRVYSTVILGVKLKYIVFFWLGSWAKILCLVIKKKSLGDE